MSPSARRDQKRVSDAPEAGVPDSRELPKVGAGNRMRFFREEEHVLNL